MPFAERQFINMKISIVMTVYNGEKYILEQITSIKNQTIPCDEVLILDDCSSDETLSIISKFIDAYKLTNWRIIRNEKQMGWKKNFINGFMIATGDIIFPCDQDDIWRLDKVEKMSHVLDTDNTINVLASNYEPFFQDGAEIFTRNYKSDLSIDKPEVSVSNLFNQRPGCSMAFRKKFFDRYYYLWNERLAHDEFLWKTGLLDGSLAIFNMIGIDYRRHAGNVTKRMHSISNRIEENIACTLYFEKAMEETSFINKKLILKEYRYYKARDQFFEKRSISSYLVLFGYMKMYKTTKNFLGDLMYLVNPRYFVK